MRKTLLILFTVAVGLGSVILARLAVFVKSPTDLARGGSVSSVQAGNVGPHSPSTEREAIDSESTGFRWSQIEADDLQVYAGRLRDSGCPEATVRDIIIGIIHRHYAPRLKALRDRGRTPFWHTLERRAPSQDPESVKREAALRALTLERDALVRELSGIDFSDYLAGFVQSADGLSDLLDCFDDQVRPEVRRILSRYDQLDRAVASRVGGTLGLPEQTELERLYCQKTEELRTILSPREVEEFELRTSPLAHRLRTADLVGFSPTEEEFRAIFRLSKANESGSGGRAANSEESQLRGILGDKRFGDYRRSQDLTYRRLVEFTSHYGLPVETAAQVHDVREAVIQQVDRLETDPRIQGVTREAVLGQIQQEAANVIQESLGEEVFNRTWQPTEGG